MGWGLGPEGLKDLLRELRFRHRKWDVYGCGRCLVLPEAIVLTPAEHARAVAVAERFAAVLRTLEEKLARDGSELAALGIPAEVHDLIAVEQDRPLQLARYDLFPAPDGRWWVSEFNEDVPGGFNEAVGIPELLAGRLPEGRFEGDLRGALLHAIERADCVGLFHATGYSEDLQHMLVIRDWLRAAGAEGVLCSPAHLRWRRGRARVLGQTVTMGVRFYPGEWFRWLPNLKDWRRAAADLPMMNPFRRLVRQSKKLFVRWADGGLLAEEDRRFVEAHTPASRPFRLGEIAELRAQQERWVLKEAFGRMGDTVVIGALTGPADWNSALAEAAKRPGDFLVQERLDVAPMDFEREPLYPALGVFLVNGRFAGYYSRAAAQPLLTHEAYHVATVVEDS